MCPVGCGWVVLVQGKVNGVIFCYCTGCGIAWRHPEETQFNSGLNNIKHIRDFSQEGIIFPKKSSIVLAGFEPWIIRSISQGEFCYSESEINEDV
jgi:hypothetical protein